jgi:hypothetical protein
MFEGETRGRKAAIDWRDWVRHFKEILPQFSTKAVKG